MTPEEITKALPEINNPDLADIINKIQLNTLLAYHLGRKSGLEEAIRIQSKPITPNS